MRDAKMWIVIAKRGTGKTNKTFSICETAAKKGRKVLMFDMKNEFYSYRYREDRYVSIKTIPYKYVSLFSVQTKGEMRRTLPVTDAGKAMGTDEMKERLSFVLENFRNGILWLEDINRYIADNQPNDLIGMLATLRQQSVDAFIHFQMIQKAANPKLLQLCNYIRLHDTGVSAEQYRDKFGEELTDMLVIAQTIITRRVREGRRVNDESERGLYFNCTIDIDERKILGIFTKNEAKEAIDRFISDNSKRTILKEYNRTDKFGKKIWAERIDAYNYLEKTYLEEYFDFREEIEE